MPVKEKPDATQHSVHLATVQQVLTGLAKVRTQKRGWFDSESEEVEQETQVYKIGECLFPFYLAGAAFPHRFLLRSYSDTFLEDDTKVFINTVKKNKFFPSPYSVIVDSKDQYTDFAAFVLSISALIVDHWGQDQRKGKWFVDGAKTIARASYDFLVKPAHSFKDNHGVRWGGTNIFSRAAKGKTELFTDVFFTAQVVLAINRTFEHAVLSLPPAKQVEAKQLLAAAGKWISSRFDAKSIKGDETKSNGSLLYSTWGIRALIETYHHQEPSVRKSLPAIVDSYIELIQDRLAADQLFQQEYLQIFSKDVDSPLYYEDRSSLGGIAMTLASMSTLIELESLLESSSYRRVMEQVLGYIENFRNPTTHLWYKQGLILSSHPYIVEAYLRLAKREKPIGTKLQVSAAEVRQAVIDSVKDDTLLATLHRTILEKLNKIVSINEQEQKILQVMANDRGLKNAANLSIAPDIGSPTAGVIAKTVASRKKQAASKRR